MTDKYKEAGVDISAGNQFVELIKPFIRKTHRPGVITDIGGFGGLFAIDPREYKEPTLVSSTDGVGTKLKLAIDLKKIDTIGTDLVAMCVNDIACCGARPLFFLDYFATGHLIPEEHKNIVKGIAEACEKVKCALIGGETAEMPDMYSNEDFDLAGFAVGIVDRQKIIDGMEVRLNQSIIGIASSGFHSNGYALIRKIIKDNNLDLNQPREGSDQPLGLELLSPTKLYSPIIEWLIREFKITSIAHITGGGLIENIPRVLPAGAKAKIHKGSWPFPPLMRSFQKMGEIDDNSMFRFFNCGLGLVIVTPKDQAKAACDLINNSGEHAYIIGSIASRTKEGPAVTFE
ncbi:MAG: phosphoribosylformylglycinamidine cyclo-ligase [Deltaproteobacteria bacterium CG07_land_8_20_14_0_80_38_7]|nr:MAG: phosphoribosylformylglycinamidine cyclo-ligase [Deltaproteobacteria bacterium CG07_land_8_20_14_0_80_38_7]